MDKADLVKLWKTPFIEDMAFPDFKKFLSDFFAPNESISIPIERASRDYTLKDPVNRLEFKTLFPMDEFTKGTLRNYFLCLNHLEQNYKPSQNLLGDISFFDFYPSDNHLIFSAHLHDKLRRVPSFSLSLTYFAKDSSQRHRLYRAGSKIIQSEIEEQCERFCGPNK